MLGVNVLVLLALSVLSLVNSECGTTTDEHTVAGDVVIDVECKGGGTITQVDIRLRRPKKGQSKWKVSGKNKEVGRLEIKPSLMLRWKCSNKDGWKKERFEAKKYLEPMQIECPKGTRLSITTLVPVLGAGAPLAELCKDKQSCKEAVPLSYKVLSACTQRGRALHCCDEDWDTEGERRACGVLLSCDCCSSDENMNLKQCDSSSGILNGKLVGLSVKGEPITDNESEEQEVDVDTMEDPGDDEEGCHVRKVTVKVNNVPQELCVPGNLAQVLRILNKYLLHSHDYSQTHCNLLHSFNVTGCNHSLDPVLPYYFQVELKLTTDEEMDDVLEDLQDDLTELFEEEFIANPCKEVQAVTDHKHAKKVTLQCRL